MEINQDSIGVKKDDPTKEREKEGSRQEMTGREETGPLADVIQQFTAALSQGSSCDPTGPTISPFDGTYSAIQFFQVFDRKMEDAAIEEKEKLLRLPNYLVRQPLELFRKLRLADRSYFQVRQILLDLYPESSEASFAKYFAMKLTGKANLETYYREKTAMGLQLGLPQEVILETLTEGLPFSDQRLVRVVPPENLGEWFRLVQRIHEPSVPTTRHREDQPPTMSGPYHNTPRRPGAWNAPLPPSNSTTASIGNQNAQNIPLQRDNSHTKHIGDHTSSHKYHMTNPHHELDTHTKTQQNPLPHTCYNTTHNPLYTPQFTTLLQRYNHIFTQNKFNVPCLRIPPVKIPTNSDKIITIRPYRVPICDQQEIRNQVQQMLENDIIEQSFSPFSSPVTLVTKRDKTKRFCIDYRKVNELISSDVHPLPRIEDILDRLAQAKYFSTADISSAYWQVPIHPDSRPLLAFATLEGLYQPTRLPFGLKTSPQIYERAMSQVLQRHGLDCVAHYFDDFIIYSNTLEEHQNHLRQFFAFCEAEELQLNFAKCEFFKQSIDFLGSTITAGTTTPLTRNTDIIHAIKQPHNRKTLQSFLGAVNVYNKFIPDYARLRAPLNNLLKKDVVWIWDETCQKAFIDLKGNLTQHPILHLYKEGLPCQVYCDASTLGIAGILKQVHPDGNVYPVQFFSRTLRPHEKNYSISELECLAIVESVEKFRIYLMGRKFTIFSDHHALQWLKTIKNPSGRLFRWSLRLSSYEYEVRYIKGKQQYEADLLSCNPFCGFLDASLIKTHQPPPSRESSLTIDRNGLHTVSRKGVTKIIIPKPLIQQLLQTVHTQYNHPGISQMSRLISTQYYWQGMSKDIKQKVKTCPTCQLTKRPLGPTYGELSQPPEAKEPFYLLSLDTIAGFANRQDKEMEINQDSIGVKKDDPTKEREKEGSRQEMTGREETGPLADVIQQFTAALSQGRSCDPTGPTISPFDGTYSAIQFFQVFDREWRTPDDRPVCLHCGRPGHVVSIRTPMLSSKGPIIRVANSKCVRALGKCVLRIKVNELTQPFEFLVLSQCSHCVILGWDFLKLTQAEINCEHDELYLKDAPMKEEPHPVDTFHTLKDNIIPPNSIKQITVVCSDVPGVQEVAITCSKGLTLEKEIVIPASIVSLNHGRGKVWMVNGTNYAKIIPEGMKVAELSIIDNSYVCCLDGDDDYLNQKEDKCSTQKTGDLDRLVSLMDTDLSHEDRSRLLDVLRRFIGVFELQKAGPKRTSLDIKHRIDTGDHAPIRQRPYRVSPYERGVIQTEVDKMLKSGIVKPSDSPWSSPVVLVKKKDGTWSLKSALTSEPVLGHFDEAAPIYVHTDASGFGIGSVLVQLRDGCEQPIAYASRTLSKSEKNYSTTEKECLAVVWLISKFRPYLFGRPFSVVTYHHSLCWLANLKDPSGRLARWALRLHEYEVAVCYKNGRKHKDADCLSRSPLPDTAEETEEDILCLAVLCDVEKEQQRDPSLKKIIENCGDPNYKIFVIINNILYKKNYDPLGRPWLLVVPRTLRLEVLRSSHDAPTAGHLGFAKTYDRIRRRFFWPSLYRSVHNYVGHCRECQRRKKIPQLPPGNLKPIAPVSIPFQKIGMDLLGRFPPTRDGNRWVIVCTDYLTKYAVTKAIPTGGAVEVAKFMVNDVVFKHGAPRELITDRGRSFQAKVVNELTKMCGMSHYFTMAYHPQTNGLTERLNKTLVDMLSMYVDVDQKNWDSVLPFITFAYNTARQETTGFSPFFLVHGREAETMLDALFPYQPDYGEDEHISHLMMDAEEARQLARLQTLKAQAIDKERYDSRYKPVYYDVGDLVQSYEEEFAKQLLETLIEDRERIEERERIEDRKRIEDRERIERERKEQMVMEFELEKLRIQTTRGNNDTSRSTSNDAHYEIRKLMPKYESKDNDLSFYLILFERQAKRLGLDEDQWAFSLLGLLPYEMTQLIARETEEQSGDYRFVKRLLLKRYKLSPEQFRQKFEKHERSQKGSWRDFAFELRRYFNEWIEGMNVENFDALKDLSVTNQLKKKVPNVLRNHLIDDWTKLNNPDELADKLDEYENVRTEMGPPHWNAKHLIPPSFQQKSARFPNQSEVKETKQGTNVSGQDAARNEISETYPNTLRRMVNRTIRNDKVEPKCFNCNQFGHIARDCPAPRTTLTCRGCGQTGHKERNCTRPKEGLKVANLEVEGLETVPPDVYLKDVKIDNKETVKAMINTGSSSCLMRESVARRISVDIEPDSTSLYGIGNQTAPAARTVGKTTVDLEIDGIVGREITVFIVNDDAQPYDLLIGRTWTDLPYVSFARIGVDDACVDSLLEVVDGKTTVPIISAGKGKLRVRKNQCVGRVELLNLDDIVVNLDVAEDSFQTKNEEKREGQDQMKRKRPILPEDINVNHSLTSKERQEILDVVNEYRDCFALGMEELGCTDVTKMDIKEVDGSKPVCLRPYKTTASEREAIREIVREWKDNGIVTETRSPYASPVLLVRKKTGDHRLVVDYRRLNIQTVKDKFPLPRIDDLLEGLRNAKFFTTLDLAHGYLQIPLTDKAKLKTAFITPDDTGQFERMIFGLANAPAEFQRLMHTVLGPLLNKKEFCYLDDVIIPAKDWREMIERLRKVLERIRSAKLTLKPSKCEFGRREVEFLGYVISTGGLKPGPRKIKAIEEFPEPKNVHDIRRFLGLTNFFRRFVKDFARKAEPLSRLTKKGLQFEWKEEQRRSFGGLRKDLVEYPVLAHYNPELKTEVHCDASAEGLAGMVLQMDEDGKWRLVYCVSKKTTEAEKMYHSSKLELMAIVWTLDRLRQFLVGIKFTVVTDCQALVYMNAKKTTNPQIARWYNLIQEYDFEIRHKPGEKMAHVDGMSRAPVDDPRDTMEEIVEKNLEVCFAITLEEQILMIQHSDPELRDLIQIFRKDPCDRTVGEQNRINDYSYKGGRLFRMVKNGEEERALYVIPKSMRKSLVVKFHDLMGHFATDRTVNKIKELYWFPSMKRYVRRHVAMCLECLFNKVPGGKQQGFLHPIKSGKRPFSIVHMDHVGPFVRSTKDHQRQRGSCFTSRQFEEFCRGNGIHHTLNSTKHPQGNGMVERVNRTVLSTIATSIEDPRRKDWDLKIKEVERDLNNAVNKTTNKTPFETLHGYSPRFHDGILRRLADEDVDPWTEPDRIQESVRTQIENKQEIMKTYYDKKKCRTIQFEVGEIVVMRHVPKMTGEPTKAQPKYRGPLIITEVLPSDTYRVTQLSERTSGRFYTTTAHISQLKSWHSEEDDSATEESPDEEPEVEDTPRRNPRRSCNASKKRLRKPTLVWVFTPVRKVGLSEKLLKKYFGPYRITKKLSDVNYEVTTVDESRRKAKYKDVVHVLRMKPYNDPETQNDEYLETVCVSTDEFKHRDDVFPKRERSTETAPSLSLSPDGNSYPVQYYSRTLRKYERNYTITELECLAIIETVDRFKVYLAGNGFTIFTDHCALQWLKNIKNPTGRLFRWSLRLSVYDYQVKYIKGTKQLEADLLSRNPFCGLLDATQLKCTKASFGIIPRPKYGELGELPESPLPFDLVSMDTIAGFSRYGSAKNYLHVVVDHATRFAWTFPSRSTSTTTYIQVIKKVLQSGCPKRLLTDRAPAFTSPRFRRFLISHNIQPMLTTSNHPQANGLFERLNATLTGKLRLLHLQHPRASWTMLQSKVVKAYNDTPHSVTGFPPSYLMDGSLPKELSQHLDPYPSVTESRRLALQRTKERHKLDKIRFDKNHRSPDFEVGDLVLTKIYQHPNTGKLVPYFSGPYEIIEVISPYTVRINRPNQAQNLETEIIHVNKLKHYSEDTKYILTPHSTNKNSKPKSYFIYNYFPPEIFHDDYKNYASTLSNPFNHMNLDIFLDNVEPTLTARYISTPDTIPKIAIRLEPSPTTKIMLPSSPTRNHTPQISPQFSAPLINCDNTKLENRSVIIKMSRRKCLVSRWRPHHGGRRCPRILEPVAERSSGGSTPEAGPIGNDSG
ncbi:hypothetical protein LAZ67_9002287, partial [Cordylochernes scorpioides]